MRRMTGRWWCWGDDDGDKNEDGGEGDEDDNEGDDDGGEGVKADEGDKSDDWLQVQQKHVDEEQLAKVISQKLLERPGVSFSEIASVALEHGRKQLAVKVSSLWPPQLWSAVANSWQSRSVHFDLHSCGAQSQTAGSQGQFTLTSCWYNAIQQYSATYNTAVMITTLNISKNKY